jgi:hypothetical protein
MKSKVLIFLILVFSFTSVLFYYHYSSITPSEQQFNSSLKNSFFYRMYSWDTHRAMIDRFYEYQELFEKTKLAMIDSKHTEKGEVQKDHSSSKDDLQDIQKDSAVGNPWAQIFASLTGSAGSIGVSGKAKNASFMVQGVSKGSSFQQGAGSSFTVDVHSSKGTKKVSVKSPSFATNQVVQSLSIGIDPYSMYMTLNGRLKLDLPGDIAGTLYNTTNGTSSSTTLQNGYFSVSVPLVQGVNNITASGKWMTIELQLPGISVTIS